MTLIARIRCAFINDVTSSTSGFSEGFTEGGAFSGSETKDIILVWWVQKGGARLFPSKTITSLKEATESSSRKRRRTHFRPVSEKPSKANRSRVDFIYRGSGYRKSCDIKSQPKKQKEVKRKSERSKNIKDIQRKHMAI